MSHRIDWTNQRGLQVVEQRIGPRHCTAMPIIGPIIFDLMESIGQFTFYAIERELRPRGWSMKTHSLTIRDIKSVIWFVNASDTSGYWFRQLRIARSNNFVWRAEMCGLAQKELYWLAMENHARKSVPHKTHKSPMFEAIIEPLDGAVIDNGPAEQSITLDGLDIKE